MKTNKFNTVEEFCLSLKKLYEGFGYGQFKMAKFEEYGLYLENKNFLTGQSVITFTDPNGKLMALKPDVTLSIVKNTKATAQKNEKVYYLESVYRPDKTTKEFKEISQMGLEFLGNIDSYGALEVAVLAAKTLQMADKNFVLDVSHPSVLGGITEKFGAQSAEKEIFAYAASKNSHDLKELCAKRGLPQRLAEDVSALAAGEESFEKTFSKAKAAAKGSKRASAAVQELQELYKAFRSLGLKDKIRLDFSLTADPQYYSGIVFAGYVGKCPHAVLTGGRYDKLAKKYADVGAMGFALNLNDIGLYFGSASGFDADVFVQYDEQTDPAKVFKAVEGFAAAGKKAVAGTQVPNDEKFCETVRLQVK